MTLEKPSLPVRNKIELNRHLPMTMPSLWLRQGWDDFKDVNMEASLLYGVVITALSILIVVGIFIFKLDYILFPALAAFLVIGPTLAIGLYEKSRRIQTNEPVSIGSMLFVQPKSKQQLVFIGLMLTLWILLWLRFGVLLYALFFGMHEFPSLSGVISLLFTEPKGYLLLITGTLTGAMFAAFAFAVSVFSVPMLLNEKTDAFTAMGASIALTWNNLPVMMGWGVLVLGLVALSLLTGLLGLIVLFPVLGHATWHIYRDVRQDPNEPIFGPAIDVHKEVL